MQTATKPRKPRLSDSERAEMQRASLSRATSGCSLTNDLAVIAAFAARGIVATPRVDVFTFNAWKALGRSVMKGEKSVRVTTWIPVQRKATDGTKKDSGMIPRTACVFHISQTQPTT